MTSSEKLERIYSNCSREYKMYIKRKEFQTLKEFITLAETYEYIMEESTGNHNRGPRNHPNSASNPRRINEYRRYENTSAVTTENSTQTMAMSSFNQERYRGESGHPERRDNAFRRMPNENYNTNPERSVSWQNNRSQPDNQQSFGRNMGSSQPNVESQPKFQCYRCGQEGHTARFCRVQNQPICAHCKRRGVSTENCQCRNAQSVEQYICPRCHRHIPESKQCDCQGRTSNETIQSTSAGTSNYQNRIEEIATIRCDPRPHLVVGILNQDFEALLDTGSTASYIDSNVAAWIDSLGDFRTSAITNIRLTDGTLKHTNSSFLIPICIGEEKCYHRFNLLTSLQCQVLIGYDLLRRVGIRLVDKMNNSVIQGTRTEGSGGVCSSIIACGALTENQKMNLNNLLEEMRPKINQVTGITGLSEHIIRMKTPEPIKQRYYSKNPKMVSQPNRRTVTEWTNRAIG